MTTLPSLLVLLAACGSDTTTDSGSTSPDSATDSGTTDTVDPNAWFDDCPADTPEQRSVDVGELSLNVTCRGAGPTVVLLHGFPEFSHAWDKVMDELAGEYRLIAPDQRGYNLSDKPEAVSDYTLDRLTADIVALLPLVSQDPVLLVGHDWGGPVAWMVGHTPDAHLRGLLGANAPHPQRFAELIATDPDQQAASAYMTFFRAEGSEDILANDDFALLASMFTSVLSEDDLATYKTAWGQEGALTGGLNWYRANDLEPGTSEALMADLLPQVLVPTVVMWGLDDDAVLPSNAEGLEPFVADLTVKTYAGVDHWIDHRIPEEIAAELRLLDALTAGD